MTRPHPQRIIAPAPVGSLLKRIEQAPRPRKDLDHTDAAHLALVRQLPCLKCGVEP